MVQRVADQWSAGFEKVLESEPEGPGRVCRALIKVVLTSTESWNDKIRETSSAVFAALAYNPKLIKPMRDFYKEMHQKIDNDGLAPGVAQTIMATIDGTWLWWVLDFRTLDQPLIDDLRKTAMKLSEMVDG